MSSPPAPTPDMSPSPTAEPAPPGSGAAGLRPAFVLAAAAVAAPVLPRRAPLPCPSRFHPVRYLGQRFPRYELLSHPVIGYLNPNQSNPCKFWP